MATFDISPLFRTATIGFERPWNTLHSALNVGGEGYPAYNIVRAGEDEFTISLAVPGYSESDISIESREGALWVKGERGTDPHHNEYLYRGISMDGFQRTFELPEHVKVRGARLDHGLLHIELVRELPEALRPRRIEIVSADGEAVAEQPRLEDASQAA